MQPLQRLAPAVPLALFVSLSLALCQDTVRARAVVHSRRGEWRRRRPAGLPAHACRGRVSRAHVRCEHGPRGRLPRGRAGREVISLRIGIPGLQTTWCGYRRPENSLVVVVVGDLVHVLHHEGLQDRADCAERLERGFVQDTRTEVVVQIVTQRLQEPAESRQPSCSST